MLAKAFFCTDESILHIQLDIQLLPQIVIDAINHDIDDVRSKSTVSSDQR